MVISKTMFKKETVERVFTLMDAGDGEIDNWKKDAEGKYFIDGKRQGLVLLWQDDAGEQLIDEMTKSSRANSGLYEFLCNTYGKPGKKALMGMTTEEYVNDFDYYYGLLEYLIGQKFNLTLEVGKYTKIKDREIVSEIALPTKAQVVKRSAELAAKASEQMPDGLEDAPKTEVDDDSNIPF